MKLKNNKKVFLDCGANMGQSVHNFIKLWDDWEEYDIHCFEPLFGLEEYFSQYREYSNFTFHNKAVWINDGNVNFYPSTQWNWGSSVIKEKNNVSKTPIEVPSIDISRWIQENFSIDDFIIFKMDIEGGEYDLIPHLLKNNTFKYINELYIEFHNHKVGKSIKDDKFLLDQINKFDTKVIDDSWTGLNFVGR